MTRRTRSLPVARILGAAAFLSVLFLAGRPAPALASGEFGIGAFASYGAYAMDDLNDEFIKPLNDSLATFGVQMDEVKNGFGFGGGLRWRSMTNVQVAVDYERLTGSTDISDPSGSFTINVPANAVTATVSYLMTSQSKFRFGFGAGLGYYSADGSVEFSDNITTITEDMSGHGIGYHAGVVLDAEVAQQIHWNVFAGWRQAKTTDLKIADTKVLKANGDDMTLDWSGLMARVGLDFYFGGKGAQ